MTNVFDLKGKPMDESVNPPETIPNPTLEQTNLLVCDFLRVVICMHQACLNTDFSHVSLRDEQGKTWSAPAIMRMIDRHMNFIRLKMGKDFNPANQRR